MGSEKNIIHQENQKDSTEVKLSMQKKSVMDWEKREVRYHLR